NKADFLKIKAQAQRIGEVKTFNRFLAQRSDFALLQAISRGDLTVRMQGDCGQAATSPMSTARATSTPAGRRCRAKVNLPWRTPARLNRLWKRFQV
ncbi:hypothetical protein MOQ05_21325, partial [Stenotrophomonas maltophilia]|nr:hypothetical protein [Stenotrophomonas maltophilia]